MKKNLFFTVMVFVLQMFNMNMLGQPAVVPGYSFELYGTDSFFSGPRGLFSFSNSKLVFETYSKTTPFAFNLESIQGLQMKTMQPNDRFALYFPNNAMQTIIAKHDIGIAAGDRDPATSPDLFIDRYEGKIGLGILPEPGSRLTANGHISIANNNQLRFAQGISTVRSTSDNTFLFETAGNYSFEFRCGMYNGLKMRKGWNNDMTLYYPIPNGNNWGRIVSQNAFAISAGNRGLTNGLTDLFIADVTGNVGIGTENPNEKLTVNGNIGVNNGKMMINVSVDEIDEAVLDAFSLFVSEGVLSEDFAVAPIDDWADYVFSSDYELQNLNEVERYIKTNNHLPNIPTATDVKRDGYSLHNMNVKLLQKVEELTLYSIEQNKEIEQLKKVANSYELLMEKVNQLEKQINK